MGRPRRIRGDFASPTCVAATSLLVAAVLVVGCGRETNGAPGDSTDARECRRSRQAGACLELFGNSLCPQYCYDRAPTATLVAPEPATAPNGSDDGAETTFTVSIRPKGFSIGAESTILPPEEGCDPSGPTVCLADGSVDVATLTRKMRSAFDEGNAERGDEILERITGAYDWRGLYGRAVDVHEKYPGTSVVRVASDGDLPYQLVVRTMDVLRYRLPQPSYDDRESFRSAQPKTRHTEAGEQKIGLFTEPVFSIVR